MQSKAREIAILHEQTAKQVTSSLDSFVLDPNNAVIKALIASGYDDIKFLNEGEAEKSTAIALIKIDEDCKILAHFYCYSFMQNLSLPNCYFPSQVSSANIFLKLSRLSPNS